MGWIIPYIGKQIRILRNGKRVPSPSVTMDKELKNHVIVFDAANILLASAVSQDNAEEIWLNGHGAVTNCEAYFDSCLKGWELEKNDIRLVFFVWI